VSIEQTVTGTLGCDFRTTILPIAISDTVESSNCVTGLKLGRFVQQRACVRVAGLSLQAVLFDEPKRERLPAPDQLAFTHLPDCAASLGNAIVDFEPGMARFRIYSYVGAGHASQRSLQAAFWKCGQQVTTARWSCYMRRPALERCQSLRGWT
jgi:hypothetical protein